MLHPDSGQPGVFAAPYICQQFVADHGYLMRRSVKELQYPSEEAAPWLTAIQLGADDRDIELGSDAMKVIGHTVAGDTHALEPLFLQTQE